MIAELQFLLADRADIGAYRTHLYIYEQLYLNFTVIKFNVLMKIQKRCR
jgi:hypothetical protein